MSYVIRIGGTIDTMEKANTLLGAMDRDNLSLEPDQSPLDRNELLEWLLDLPDGTDIAELFYLHDTDYEDIEDAVQQCELFCAVHHINENGHVDSTFRSDRNGRSPCWETDENAVVLLEAVRACFLPAERPLSECLLALADLLADGDILQKPVPPLTVLPHVKAALKMTGPT